MTTRGWGDRPAACSVGTIGTLATLCTACAAGWTERRIVVRDTKSSGVPVGAVEEEQYQSQKDAQDSDVIDPLDLTFGACHK